MDKEQTFVYKYDGKLYINLTNQCHNSCEFCIRHSKNGLPGQNLWLSHEPTAEEVKEQYEALGGGDIVFCGYGEPTMALSVLKEIATYVKSSGHQVRLNTNGLANAHFRRNIVRELAHIIDTVSISLNAPDAKSYHELCHSTMGENAHNDVVDFAKHCVAAGMDTILTVVDTIGPENIERCKWIAEEIGAHFRVRSLIE